MSSPRLTSQKTSPPESVWTALVAVYDSGQRLALERIELAKLELIGFARGELVVIARQLVRRTILGLAGSLLLIAGWLVLGWGLLSLTDLRLAWRLVIDAALNLSLGGVLLGLASRHGSPHDESPSHEVHEART